MAKSPINFCITSLTSSCRLQKDGVEFGVNEEQKRGKKKSEEVLEIIKRARQRREEEENHYRREGEGCLT